MRRERISWIIVCSVFWLMVWTGVVRAQEDEGVDLRIRLRASDGSAVVGELVVLQRLPEEVEITLACRTDDSGACAWRVQRGLYQVLFSRPLDAVSALAVAEGGLHGLGITVGDASIAYHFTFHRDGRVYFDAAPEANVPVPIIPIPDSWHGGVVATAVPPIATLELVAVTPLPEPTVKPTAVGSVSTGRSWRFLSFISLGLMAGGSFHLWTRKRKLAQRAVKKEVDDA